ncbi:MAG: nitroreductase family protein [Acidaminococcus sp.]|nr:nitroreductase family protein [Acidaminococcus sp.]
MKKNLMMLRVRALLRFLFCYAPGTLNDFIVEKMENTMKNFLTLAKERYSVREYLDKPIEPEKMEKILTAAKVAPTAANHQPFRIYILKSEKALETIRSLTPCAFNAPVVLMMTYSQSEQWKHPQEQEVVAGQEDVSIVATHIMLQAWDLGIASCWVNAFPHKKTEEVFHIPEDEKVVLLMPLGYGNPEYRPTPKHTIFRDKDELVKVL